MVLVGNNNNTAQLWSVSGGKPKFNFTSHTDAVNTVGFLDTKKCFTGSSDNTIKIWDLNKGNATTTFLCGSKCFSAVSNMTGICSGHNNGYIKMWSEQKKIPVMEKKIHTGAISYLLISSDHNRLVGGPDR